EGEPARENVLAVTSSTGVMDVPLSTVRTLNSVLGPVPDSVAFELPVKVVLHIRLLFAMSNTPLLTMLPWRINWLVTVVPVPDTPNCPPELIVRLPSTSTV